MKRTTKSSSNSIKKKSTNKNNNNNNDLKFGGNNYNNQITLSTNRYLKLINSTIQDYASTQTVILPTKMEISSQLNTIEQFGTMNNNNMFTNDGLNLETKVADSFIQSTSIAASTLKTTENFETTFTLIHALCPGECQGEICWKSTNVSNLEIKKTIKELCPDKIHGLFLL